MSKKSRQFSWSFQSLSRLRRVRRVGSSSSLWFHALIECSTSHLLRHGRAGSFKKSLKGRSWKLNDSTRHARGHRAGMTWAKGRPSPEKAPGAYLLIGMGPRGEFVALVQRADWWQVAPGQAA